MSPRKCDAERILALLGRPHTLAVVRTLFEESPLRFGVLKERTQTNSKTLSTRLKALSREGIVERREHREIPPRVEYSLTPMGRDLARIFEPFEEWRRKYAGRWLP